MDNCFGIPASRALSSPALESFFILQVCQTEALAINIGALANVTANVGEFSRQRW
jgi:hypothetical protein